MGILTPKRSIAACALALVLAASPARAAEPLRGVVVDRETGKPVAFANVILDGERGFITTEDGEFNFGVVADGEHVVDVSHISYEKRSVKVRWPAKEPLRIELEPSQFTTERIVVKGERTIPSIPVGSVAFTREELTAAPGNIANDPLRTLQSQPACATDGVDFLSKMAVRGGDSEEHRVYLDGYPLRHYSHVGGFASIVYDDMLERTTLVPGAAPIRYTGLLSGVVLLEPVRPDTTFRSFRYDITSMAGGVSEIVSDQVSLQAAAKTDFFNLPVYQQQGVKNRSFRDFYGRALLAPTDALRATVTLLVAGDSETGNYFIGQDKERSVTSTLAGLDLAYHKEEWEVGLRPYYSYYDSRDAIAWSSERAHRLNEYRLAARLARRGNVLGVVLHADGASIRHEGSGGDRTEPSYAASAEVSLIAGEYAALVLGGGGSREPWTKSLEPEGYASARVNLGPIASVSAGARRSHQSPFLFSERRSFASLPIDASDLMGAYDAARDEATAVRMDQTSVGATLYLPLGFSASYHGFHRWYRNLLEWNWDDFPAISDVSSDGYGHATGYEVVFERTDAKYVSVMAAISRARVTKREGSLATERIGDFDRPHSWQAGASVRVTNEIRIAFRWMDVDGRPYTLYDHQDYPPSDAQVNALRLPRFQRLDVKISHLIQTSAFTGAIFVDIINFQNRHNTAMMQALESAPDTFTSRPYGGTKWFPIAGMTVRW